MIQVISDGWSCTVNHTGLISASWFLSNAQKNSMDIKQHYLIIKRWTNIFPILVMQRILVIYLSVIFFLRERFSLSSLCWPETGYIDLVSIELTEICWPLLELKAYWSKNHCCNRVFKIWINVRNYPERPLAWYFNHSLVLYIERKRWPVKANPAPLFGTEEHTWHWQS